MNRLKLALQSAVVAMIISIPATVLNRLLCGMSVWDEKGIRHLSPAEVIRDYHQHTSFWLETFIIFMWAFLPSLLAGFALVCWRERVHKPVDSKDS